MKATEKVELESAPTTGTIETFTVVHGRKGAEHGVIFARTGDGKRFIAKATPDALERLREDSSPVGAAVTVETADEVNTFRFA